MSFGGHCSRCDRVADTETAEAEGWIYYEDDDEQMVALVCPGCQTEDDYDKAWPDAVPANWQAEP